MKKLAFAGALFAFAATSAMPLMWSAKMARWILVHVLKQRF